MTAATTTAATGTTDPHQKLTAARTVLQKGCNSPKGVQRGVLSGSHGDVNRVAFDPWEYLFSKRVEVIIYSEIMYVYKKCSQILSPGLLGPPQAGWWIKKKLKRSKKTSYCIRFLILRQRPNRCRHHTISCFSVGSREAKRKTQRK